MTSSKLESTVENTEHRSGYGDMHEHRGALMIAQHVEILRRHNIVDAAMAAELMKPVYRDRKYTPAYLGTHPDYTGVQPEMTALSTADRHQKQRDNEMKKLVKDYEVGLIDEDGNPNPDVEYATAQDANIESSESNSDHNSEPAISPQYSTDASEAAEPMSPSQPSSKSSSLVLHASDESEISSTPEPPARKRKYRVNPLQPLPGGEDYSQYKYYPLLAVCRERQIFASGDTQEVRNCLIQDDINIAQGLPRDIAKWKSIMYKNFKHDVPDALKQSGVKK